MKIDKNILSLFDYSNGSAVAFSGFRYYIT
jgi:hypothetical protein